MDPANLDCVTRLLAEGIGFSFATGRLPKGLPSLNVETPRAALLGPHIVHNGAQVWGASSALATFGVSSDQTRSILTASQRLGLYAEFYTDDGFYATHADPAAQASWQTVTGPPKALATQDLLRDASIIKVTVVDFSAAVPFILPDGYGLSSEESTAPIFPTARIYNITAEGVSKGSSLDWMATHVGVATSDMVVIGDGLNDISMLAKAGTAIVMPGAPDEVMEHAHFVAPAHESAGFAHAILDLRSRLR